MGFEVKSPKDLSTPQKKNLDNAIMKTPFEDKWSKWISDFVNNPGLHPRNDKEFKGLDKLRLWRNELAHYKLHHLNRIHDEIETIQNARESVEITIEAIIWYYKLIDENPPDWLAYDIGAVQQ